ncbi:651_t:CDS:2, partial [Gigaspora margarita]
LRGTTKTVFTCKQTNKLLNVENRKKQVNLTRTYDLIVINSIPAINFHTGTRDYVRTNYIRNNRDRNRNHTFSKCFEKPQRQFLFVQTNNQIIKHRESKKASKFYTNQRFDSYQLHTSNQLAYRHFMGDIDWDSFITLPDIFNDVNLPQPSDYEDDNSIINNNLCQSTCNHNDIIVNTNLLPPHTEYYDNGDNPSLFEDNNNPSPLFEDGTNSSLFEDDNNFNTNSSSFTENDNNLNTSYQYNLSVGNYFDDWPSVDRFMHNYCLERGFGYQVFRNDKDLNDPSIIRRKSFRCSSSGTYEPKKVIDQNSHRIRGTTKTDCEWHCNFTFPKTVHKVKCTTLKDIHNHEVNPAQICDIIARYRRFNEEMMQDIKFFSDCKVAPITQLEMLKKKYPQHVFHKQDVYNAIYKLRKNNIERLDSVSFLDTLFEKMSQDPCWKVFVRHSGTERRLSGVFWMSPSQQELYRRFSDIVLNDNTCKTNKFNMYLSVFMVKDNHGKFRNVANALVEDELSSTYVWILQCLSKATDNIVPQSFWTDAEPGLINAVSQVFPNTQHFYCLFHIWQNIVKHLKASLGSKFYNFSRAFYSCRNSLSIEIFEQKWESMIKTFPESIGLPHISSQFFSTVDHVLVDFLTPLILSLQRFQISQSFTYEGQREHMISEDLCFDTIDNDFVEDVVDEPQATLKAILSDNDKSSINEIWRIRRIGGISCKENLVVLFNDGSHICTCMEVITKGIICRHFWRVMLYSSAARFHISIIPIRWYKDDILITLDQALKNSPSLMAIESSTDTAIEVNLNLRSLKNFQGSSNYTSVQQVIPKKNRFGVAFSTAKTAINIALETKSDDELVQLLKNFISTKRSIDNISSEEIINNETQDKDGITPLQRHLIDQTNDPHVTKIRGAPSKKRMKSAIELSKKKNVGQEITSQINNTQSCAGETSLKPQRKCLLCGTPGHYQKRCPNSQEN